MLGNSTTQNTFKTSYSITTTPKVELEWNYNTYYKPRLCGSVLNSTSSTNTADLNNLISMTELSGPTFQSSYRNGISLSSKSFSILTSMKSDNITPKQSDVLSFSATKDYGYKITFFAKTNSGTVDSVMLIFNEYMGTTELKTGVSRKFNINSAGWTFNELFYSPSSESSTLTKMMISTESAATVYISDFSVAKVTRNEYIKQHLFKAADVFSSHRPGEELSNNSIDRELSSVIYRGIGKKDLLGAVSISASRTANIVTATASAHTLQPGDVVTISGFSNDALNGRFEVISSTSTTFTYKTSTSGTITGTGGTATFTRCADISVVSKVMLGDSKNRIYLPGSDRLSYYIDSASGTSSVSGVFAYYDKELSVNKIVVKMLNSGTSYPDVNSNYGNTLTSYKLHTYSSGSWTTHSISGMDKNGYLSLYWNGSSWTTTKSTSTIQESDFTLTNSVKITGIAFSVDGIETDSSKPDNTVRYLELSPRLELDMTNYLVSFSSNNETDSGNLPIAVGTATANNASVVFENIARIYNSHTFSIFSDTSGVSPLHNLVQRDVKVKVKYLTGSEELKFFTGYVDSWSSGEEDATANLYDYAKVLQKKRNRDLLIFGSDLSLKTVITELLEQNGVSDYRDFPDMKETMLAFYSEPEKTVWENIQELLLPYSYLAYFDESGMLNVSSYRNKVSSEHTFVFTDSDTYSDSSGSYIANIEILEVNKSDQPSEIDIRYSSLSRSLSTDIGENDIKNNKAYISSAIQSVWASQPEGLSYSYLKSSISATDTTILLDKSKWNTDVTNQWVSYSGYAIIGPEIISYDGLEFKFNNLTRIVRSMEEFDAMKSEALKENLTESEFKLLIEPTGRIMNVERGLFGTKAQAHYVSSTIDNILTNTPGMKVFTKSGSSNPVLSSSPENYLTIGNNGSTKTVRLTGLTNAATLKSIMLFDGVDSNKYNNYMVSFNIAKSNASNSSDDSFGMVIGFDSTNGDGLYLEIPSNTNKTMQAKLYSKSGSNSTTWTSNAKLNNHIDAVKEKKDSSGKITVKAVKESWNKLQTVMVKISNNGNVSVLVNGKYISFKNSLGKTEIPTFKQSRTSSDVGVYCISNNSLDINSISAWRDGSVIVGPKSVVRNYNSSALLNGGVIDRITPFYFNSQSSISGVGLYDIQYTSGPGYNPEVFVPQGSFEVKSKSNPNKTELITVPPTVIVPSTIESSGYRARFMLINTGTTYVPLSGNSDFSGLSISAKVLVRGNERLFKHKVYDSLQTSQPIELSSDWIQSETQAKKSARIIATGIAMSSDTISINCFGNPLIQVGDIVKLKYSKANLMGDEKYIVVSTQNSYNSGFTTSLTLRKISV